MNEPERLGYILFIKGKKSVSYGLAAREFYFDDPKQHPTRHAFLPIKTNTRFNVYYKHKGQWVAVTKNFQSLSETMPYLQTSERVLVEYQ